MNRIRILYGHNFLHYCFQIELSDDRVERIHCAVKIYLIFNIQAALQSIIIAGIRRL